MMLTPRDVLFGLLLPALVGVAMFFACRRRPRPESAEQTGNDAGNATPIALAVAYVLSDAALFGTPRFPPAEAIGWVYFAAIAMLILLPAPKLLWRWQWTWLAIAGVVFAAMIYAMAKPLVEQTWTTGESIAWLAGSWIAAMAVTLSIAGVQRSERGTVFVAGQAIVLALGAAVVLVSGSQTFGQKAAILPGTLVPIVLLAIFFKTNLVNREAAPVFVLLFGGILLCAHWYTELTALNAALLFVAPLGAWLVKIPAVKILRTWQRNLIELAAMSIPAAIAFGLALSKFLADMAERSAYGY
jgi:hypothetical protein